MTITERDRRALILLGVVLIVSLTVAYWPAGSGEPDVVGPTGSVAETEQRLQRVRQLAAQVPARQQQLEQLTAELATWEAGIIEADTAQQAQAEVLQVLRRISVNQTPALEFRSEEFGLIRGLGDGADYGEAIVSVTFDCAIEELVNLMADLTAQTEVMATDEIRISPVDSKQKILRVRLSVAGLIPSRLVPAQRGLTTF